MKIALIFEGSYPYVHGGVSSWAHDYIQSLPEHEFVIWTVHPGGSVSTDPVYEMPANVVAFHEVFLDQPPQVGSDGTPVLRKQEKSNVQALIQGEEPSWSQLFQSAQEGCLDPAWLTRSADFITWVEAEAQRSYPLVPFTDYYYSIQSMFTPLLTVLGAEIPDADAYHAISTGYAGLLGAMASHQTGRPLFVTEHGIYSREREEEILSSSWVLHAMKQAWVQYFNQLAQVAYDQAERITSLFENARKIQVSLGAPAQKTKVISNGIHYERFNGIPLKGPSDWVDIGAVIRLAPIKDVLNLIRAFSDVSQELSYVRLHILGDTVDPDYAQQCYQLVEDLGLDRVIFAGRVDVRSYMRDLDFTVLSSLSEGQPLAVLESLAAGRPCVTTDVGACRELLEGGPFDHLGLAGYTVPPTDSHSLGQAMTKMALSEGARWRMGQVGRQRVARSYQHQQMIKQYQHMYEGRLS
ncbi:MULTISPECIES: GT4 family glycosyltransferase PelF [unclassified Streptococcus]|uniref:GT4 family glycosyltransferase PelF n=1 Tax=unclassified Streptococcus TaxID=2608887 RepID=UPI0018A961C4|nr:MULTISPECIES: GT4 family glycosyltransferase PelF [unclassified Streptococcus]MBF8970244.1 GT4 family glycosyltransferase PelF [Streptococcus sp. NLN76]MBG9366848.1 GT4 family glycosyltransferase PelF [Streptococcus sp. NLN64]